MSDYSCKRCGKAFDSEPAVVGHMRWCKGLRGLEGEVKSIIMDTQKLTTKVVESTSTDSTYNPANKGGGGNGGSPANSEDDYYLRYIIEKQNKKIERLSQMVLNHMEHLSQHQSASKDVWLYAGLALLSGLVIGSMIKGNCGKSGGLGGLGDIATGAVKSGVNVLTKRAISKML